MLTIAAASERPDPAAASLRPRASLRPGLALLAGLLAGCAAVPVGEGPRKEAFHPRSLAKTDIDSVAESMQAQLFGHVRELMIKLYRRNPRELRKSPGISLNERVEQVFGADRDWSFPELQGRTGVDCMILAFEPDYPGDRVLAFTLGLTSMLLAAYDDKTRFYLFDQVDPQKLYNSARNVEIAVWRLSNRRDGEGDLYLRSNSEAGEAANLSFERLFGKIIALQDALAVIIADRENRVIKKVILNVATAAFLPI